MHAPSSRYHIWSSADVGVREALQRLRRLSFPDLGRLATTRQLREPLIAVIAADAAGAIGLALAERQADGGAELISLFVAPEHRRQGVGAALIHALRQAAAQLGCCELRLITRDSWPAMPVLMRLLARQGWETPQPHMLLARSTCALMATALLKHPPVIPPGFWIFPWTELEPAERVVLQTEAGMMAHVPAALRPLQYEAAIEGATSLGLRYGTELIGWIICQRAAPEVIQYSSLYVRPPFQQRGRGIPLLLEALRRQCLLGVPRAIFQVDASNTVMVRFVLRRMRPYLTDLTLSRLTRLPLVREPTG